MHLASCVPQSPSFIVKQSSRISSVQISPANPPALRFSWRFRFSGVSFLLLRIEGNTRATVIGGSSSLSPRFNPVCTVNPSLFLRFRVSSFTRPIHPSYSLAPNPLLTLFRSLSLFHDLDYRFLAFMFPSVSLVPICAPYPPFLAALSVPLVFTYVYQPPLSLCLPSQFNGGIGGSVTVPLEGLSVYQMIRDSVELNVPMVVDGLSWEIGNFLGEFRLIRGLVAEGLW